MARVISTIKSRKKSRTIMPCNRGELSFSVSAFPLAKKHAGKSLRRCSEMFASVTHLTKNLHFTDGAVADSVVRHCADRARRFG
jgi:hypothetical protein